VKKLFFATLCLLFVLILPLSCFAKESDAPLDANTFSSIMNVIWYVILAVLFSGGLILVSKWSKKINERDAELERQLSEQQLLEEEEEQTKESVTESENNEEQPSTEENTEK
jgi:flagellar biosynthesis/type III secretory pathway M-ring protein FliF/YscJ